LEKEIEDGVRRKENINNNIKNIEKEK